MSNPRVRAELVRIGMANGGLLRAADVVKSARSRTSVLHPEFEWDDSRAGHQHRLWQARNLIRVTVDYLGPEDHLTESRVFVSLATDRKLRAGGYRAMTTVLAHNGMRAQLLSEALVEMRHFQARYSALRELAAVFIAMEAVTIPTRRGRSGAARVSA